MSNCQQCFALFYCSYTCSRCILTELLLVYGTISNTRSFQRCVAYQRVALASIKVLKAVALIRGWCLFDTQRLLVESHFPKYSIQLHEFSNELNFLIFASFSFCLSLMKLQNLFSFSLFSWSCLSNLLSCAAIIVVMP